MYWVRILHTVENGKETNPFKMEKNKCNIEKKKKKEKTETQSNNSWVRGEDIEQVFRDDLELKLFFLNCFSPPASSPWGEKHSYPPTSTLQCLLNTEKARSVAVKPIESLEDSLEEERREERTKAKTERVKES